MEKKFCRDIIALVFLVLLSLQIPAQQKAFKVGDVLPEDFWTKSHQIVNSPQKTTTLGENKNQLILLDFWATWCSACLLNFPKMEALEKQFEGKLKVLAVSYESRALLEKFFLSKNGQRFKNIVSVSDDKILSDTFPHLGIPFVVWIKDGKVLNTTDGRQVTAENIDEVMKGHSESLQTVSSIDRKRPFMLDESFDRQRNVSMLNYSIFLKGHVPDIGSGGAYKYTADKIVKGRQITNLPLYDFYYTIGANLFKSIKSTGKFTNKRMILNLKDESKFYGTGNEDGIHQLENLYSYELIVPPNRVDSLYYYMLDDLNRYSDFNAKIEIRETECLVLKRTTNSKKFVTKGGKKISTFPRAPSILQNAPIHYMVNMINGNTPIELPLIDETGITENVDLKISGVFSEEQLARELAPYGLTVIRATRPLEMLVISDK